ncbi:DUF2892 domain-containing protein [Candidatus Pacearchaeota archaeon]|nr:MAG: DUF2892 domain-containing protein [Candidatus Pacearchaeota archaeon]
MECNVGTWDKVVRVVLAIGVAYLGYVYTPWLYALSLVLLLTAAFGMCPIYKALGLNTCKK